MRRAVIALLGVVILCGCVQAKADISISDDDHITVLTQVMVEQGQAHYLGREVRAEDICDSLSAEFPGAMQNPLHEAGYVGCEVKATLRLDQLSSYLSHRDGAYELRVSPYPGLKAEQLSSIQIAVRFPGRVIAYSGSPQRQGSQVLVWTEKEDYLNGKVAARGLDQSSEGPLWWVILGAAGAILGMAVIIFAMKLRKLKK